MSLLYTPTRTGGRNHKGGFYNLSSQRVVAGVERSGQHRAALVVRRGRALEALRHRQQLRRHRGARRQHLFPRARASARGVNGSNYRYSVRRQWLKLQVLGAAQPEEAPRSPGRAPALRRAVMDGFVV